jgi:hypothetical protein
MVFSYPLSAFDLQPAIRLRKSFAGQASNCQLNQQRATSNQQPATVSLCSSNPFTFYLFPLCASASPLSGIAEGEDGCARIVFDLQPVTSTQQPATAILPITNN